jgi:hypothetical protein
MLYIAVEETPAGNSDLRANHGISITYGVFWWGFVNVLI